MKTVGCISAQWGRRLYLHPHVSRFLERIDRRGQLLILAMLDHSDRMPSSMRAGKAVKTRSGAIVITTRCTQRGPKTTVTLSPGDRKKHGK